MTNYHLLWQSFNDGLLPAIFRVGRNFTYCLSWLCIYILILIFTMCLGSLWIILIFLIAALLCKISALRSFSLDKLHYWRESASGISSLAHFLSKDTLDHFNTLIKPLVYLSTFYFFSNPRSSFQDNYIILLCLVYCVTGIAYALAIYLDPSPAQLVLTERSSW